MNRNQVEEELEALFRAQDLSPHFQHLRRPSGVASRFVPGDGSLSPKVIFVGEAPGQQEDRVGSPFVGPAGKFLDELLFLNGWHREEVWITNVVKLRPPRNRTPTEAEVAAARPYLRRELALVGQAGCRMIVGLGRTACEAIAGEAISPLSSAGSVRRLKGGWELFISPHPSWAIRSHRNEERMREVFEGLAYYLAHNKREDG